MPDIFHTARAALLALVCLAMPVQAQEYHVGPVVAIDGDTLRVWDAQGKEEVIRVLGLDTPETYGADCDEERERGFNAHGRLQHLLNVYAGRVRFERKLKLNGEPAADLRGRTLARVLIGVSAQDVALMMIQEGRARAYNGGRRAPWCPAPFGQPREGAY
jgi:endonuclease YncB( thermonuclease family)